MWHNISFLLLFLTNLVLVHLTHAQNSPQDFVNAHNSARSAITGVGPIVWDNTVATYAQNYANTHIGDCSLVHSGGPYGENLAKGSGTFTGTFAVNLWVAEKPYYNYTSNSCVAGKQCGHYTQVVWKNSVRLGCARVQCTNGWYWVVCSYDPPGNYVGQRPY